MRRPIISVLGSIHMDFVVFVDRIPRLGETIIGRRFETHYGGKGANQAVAAARLGSYVYMISRVGGDFIGDKLIDNLRRNKVDVSHVKKDETTHSGIALIMVDNEGNNIIAVASGADMKICKEDVDEALDDIAKSDYLLVQLEIPLETVEYAVRRAYEKGVRVILNPAPARPLTSSILKYINVLTPNRVEAEMISGVRITSMDDVVKAGRRIIELGVENAVITLGEKGAMIVTKETHVHVPGVKVKPVDTTGAGDAFNGALAVALAEGRSLEEAVKFANYAAALKITKVGAQTGLPTRSELKEFINQYKEST